MGNSVISNGLIAVEILAALIVFGVLAHVIGLYEYDMRVTVGAGSFDAELHLAVSSKQLAVWTEDTYNVPAASEFWRMAGEARLVIRDGLQRVVFNRVDGAGTV